MSNKLTCTLFLMVVFGISRAQYFETQHDTAFYTVGTTANIYNLVTNISSTPITITWHVTNHDFPPDWSNGPNLGICDNALCRTNINNQLLNGNVFTSAPYIPGKQDDFHMVLNLSQAGAGTHYIKVQLACNTQVKDIVFVINHFANGVQKPEHQKPLLYPNPVSHILHIEKLKNIREVKICDLNGNIILSKPVGDNAVLVDVTNLPTAAYFILYLNHSGQIMGSDRFLRN